MANPRASHQQRLLEGPAGGGGARPQPTVGAAASLAGSPVPGARPVHRPSAASSLVSGGPTGGPTGSQNQTGRHTYKQHQRRQSVARLLPDISKLRLLSWLVEASSELINCNIAIMDGVYAKLNKSQESLLFWTNNAGQPAAQGQQHSPAPTSNLVISQQRRKQQKQLLKQQDQQLRRANKRTAAGSRNHHSLPLTNYDASSMAAVSFISAGSSSLSRSLKTNVDSDSVKTSSSSRRRQQARPVGVCSAESSSGKQPAPARPGPSDYSISAALAPLNSLVIKLNNHNSDSNQSDADDDDGNSSAASSTTSSGIHGIATSLSSTSSASSGCSRSSAASSSSTSSSSAGSTAGLDASGGKSATGSACVANMSDLEAPPRFISSAEQLSEKIRRTVMEHNYIQSLLVNIIRQHDRQRDLLNQQRRRHMSYDHSSRNFGSSQYQQHPAAQQKIDLADIADALDDGCPCCCHSDQQHRERAIRSAKSKIQSSQQTGLASKAASLPASSSQTSANQTSQQHQQQAVAGPDQVPARKVRRSKKLKAANSDEARRELLEQLADKLCESCLETHFWLHGNANSAEFQLEALPATYQAAGSGQSTQLAPQQLEQLNTVISKRNAAFIKLVQQEVRATIGKSIELIDLIRREIKSPESIKQKQLMRCFSTSIQLLTSVGNYVVPAQDISSFIPEEIGQNQTSLFSLPSSDFDHLLLYSAASPPSPINHQSAPASQQNNQALTTTTSANSNYHLAPAPEIPVRRKFNQQRQHQLNQQVSSSSLAIKPASGSRSLPHVDGEPNSISSTSSSVGRNQLTAKIKAEDAGVVESSSGASSNNSSASSSIARGAVQQSSLTRAQTSSAILEGAGSSKTTGHDLSYDAIANLSRQQTGDDMFLQTRPKFWQSPKFNFIKKLLHVKEQRLLRQQSKDRRIYNNKVQNKFRLVMMDLTHFNKSQQLLTTENGVNSLLTSMRNVLEFGLYLTLKLY